MHRSWNLWFHIIIVIQNWEAVISTHYRIVSIRIQVPGTDLMLVRILWVQLFPTSFSLTFGAPLVCSDPEFISYQVLYLLFLFFKL